MSKQRRKFPVDENLQIIQEADQQGITQTLRKYNVSHSAHIQWKRKFDQRGISLKSQYHTIDPELKALQEVCGGCAVLSPS